MALSVLVIDQPVGSASGLQTVLGLPLGAGSVLDDIVRRLGRLLDKELQVILPDGPAAELKTSLSKTSSSAFSVLGPTELRKALSELETSDRLLLIRARDWPTAGYDADAIGRAVSDYHGATYGVAVGSDQDNTREVVERDFDGRVRRVQRFYNIVNWPEAACTSMVYALVPGHALQDVPSRELGDVRLALSRRGMLTRDLPLASECLDLGVEAGFLAAHERVLDEVFAHAMPPAGYTLHAPGVWVGEGASIDPSARVIGPVIVQAGAVVGPECTVVGPAVLGRGSRVERGAALAQSVLAGGAVVPSGRTVRHRCVLGQEAGERPPAVDLTFPLRSSGAGYFKSEESFQQLEARRGERNPVQQVLKRTLDVFASVAGLILLSPLLALTAVAVRMDSPGPILFGHLRERKGGKQFRCLKFRTMVANADLIQRQLYKKNEVDGPQFKMSCDPRVTRIGRWLRATNLDELPQLINVVLGHMSLVGPRPSPFRENQICVPWRRARLSVRPGITGLWQVCRGEDRTSDFHQWIFYDIAYVRNYSLWLDLKILGATVLTLGGRWSVPLSWMIRPGGKTIRPQPPLRPELSAA
jgi:lipopolysaccharide/colanic/teichoic acid biosynthesis glycosyltransferase